MLTTEIAIIFPIVVFVVLMVVQGALWAHAGAVAQAAADHGAEVAATLGSDDADGIAAAEDFANNAGSLSGFVASANNDTDSALVNVSVTGTYATLFGQLSIDATATTVRERIPAP